MTSLKYPLRKQQIARVTRRIAECPTETIWTLWGKEIRQMTKQCDYCEVEYPLNNFYCKSLGKMKNKIPLTRDDFESTHIGCWDKRSKRNRKYRRNPATVELLMVHYE